jgi:nucleotide-binding universal stress UspA family protein
MYNKILVPIVFDHEHDHSRALRFAAIVAGPSAKTTLLHVIEKLPTYVISYIPEKASQNLHNELQQEMNSLLKDIPGSDGKIITGHPGRTIIDYANQNSVDLIIVESHRPGLEDYFLGSTAGYIVRHAKCAVHVIR